VGGIEERRWKSIPAKKPRWSKSAHNVDAVGAHGRHRQMFASPMRRSRTSERSHPLNSADFTNASNA
jgi:hypothetical protein